MPYLQALIAAKKEDVDEINRIINSLKFTLF